MNLVLVSCVAAKRSVPSPAKALYVSAWFEKAKAYAERNGDAWRILSAQYGLVGPDEVIAPYDCTLNTQGVAQRRDWAARVAVQVAPLASEYDTLTLLAGQRYREFLLPLVRSKFRMVDVPMEGLTIGRQLQWLDRRAGTTR